MASDWPTARIAEVAEKVGMGPFGSSIKVSTFVPEGIPVISGQHLHGTRLQDTFFNFISPEHADKLKSANVYRGDVVFTHAGNIGQAAYIPETSRYERYVLSQRQFFLRCDRTKLLPEFAAYFFSSADGRHLLLANASQVGVPSISRPVTYLRTIEIPLPPVDEQRAIAHILGTLDDKIELNRRMNDTLEAIARALFKSWFVDFGPVRAKSEGRDVGLPPHLADLFPDSFEDSELGGIPTGWKIGRFGDVIEQKRDQENPLSSPDALFQHFSIPAFDEGQSPRLEYGASIKSEKTRVPTGVVLLSKLNPEIERVWIVDVRQGERAVCSTEFLVLRALSPFTRTYAYCLARSPLFRQQIEGLVTGTSKSHQHAQVESILRIAVVVPPSPVLEAFDGFADSLLARTLDCRQESHTLADLRDALLPTLVSGELRLHDADRLVDTAPT